LERQVEDGLGGIDRGRDCGGIIAAAVLVLLVEFGELIEVRVSASILLGKFDGAVGKIAKGMKGFEVEGIVLGERSLAN
jgi:hypothetical protein